MTLPFLEVFPREIRDQIYRYVLESPSGKVTLTPWSVDVAKSLTLLRTCRQIHQECKDIIWHDNQLKIRYPSQLSQKFHTLSLLPHTQRIRHLRISLELLDSHELEWASSALKGLKEWSGLKTITLTAAWEKTQGIKEFQEELALRASGESLDGRLHRVLGSSIHSPVDITTMKINTCWPPFTHWGKHNWLREMLLDSSRIKSILWEMHSMFGGELWVDGLLCYRRNMIVNDPEFNPREVGLFSSIPYVSSGVVLENCMFLMSRGSYQIYNFYEIPENTC
jgi:hypothetical protein